MRYVESSFDYVPQEAGIEGMYRIMERAARQCYKTENLIKEGSAHRIIDEIIIPRGHTSVLEFGTVYLKVTIGPVDSMENYEKYCLVNKYVRDRYSRVRFESLDETSEVAYITTTYRTIMQGDYDDPKEAIKNNFDKNWKSDLEYWCEPTEFHYKRYTYHFVMDRAGSQSVERHRGEWGISYAQESTRFVNYELAKWASELTFCYSSKFYELVDKYSLNDMTREEQRAYLLEHDAGWRTYEHSLKTSEEDYMRLVGQEGWKPEDARGVLNLDVKTEFLMCAYPSDWEMFLFRRTDSHAHPQIQRITKELREDLYNNMYNKKA